MATSRKLATAATGWTNPGNVYADDNTYATAAPGKNSTVSMTASGFGFDIPPGAEILSVTIEGEYRVSTTASNATYRMQARYNGTARGTQYSDASEPTSDTIRTDNNTGTWTAQELNSSLLQVQVDAVRGNSNTAVTFYLDYVAVTVEYLPLAAAGELTGSGQVQGTGEVQKATAGSLLGTGILISLAVRVKGAQGQAGGTGELLAEAEVLSPVVHLAAGQLVGEGELAGTLVREGQTAATLEGAGSQEAAFSRILWGQAGVSGGAEVSALCERILMGSAVLAGAEAAGATGIVWLEGQSGLIGNGSIQGTGWREVFAEGCLLGEGDIWNTCELVGILSSSVEGTGAAQGMARVELLAGAVLWGFASLGVAGQVDVPAGALLAGAGEIRALLQQQDRVLIVLEGEGTFLAAVSLEGLAESELQGTVAILAMAVLLSSQPQGDWVRLTAILPGNLSLAVIQDSISHLTARLDGPVRLEGSRLAKVDGTTIRMVQGESLEIEVTVTDGEGNAVDLTGSVAKFAYRGAQGEAVTKDCTVSQDKIQVALTPAETALLQGQYVYEVRIRTGADKVDSLVIGQLLVSAGVLVEG